VSTVPDTEELAAQASAGRPGGPGAGLGAAVKVELAKLTSQLQWRVILAGCVLVPIAFAVAMRVTATRPADTLFGRWSGTSGFAASLFILDWAGAWGVPLMAGLLAGDIFASEDRHGTWKTLLTRSATRTQLFLGKSIAATLSVLLGFVVVGAVSIAAGLAVVGSAPLVGLSGQLIPSGHAFALVLAAWALSLLPTIAFAALGLLFSIASRSGVIGVLGPLVVAIVLQALETIAGGQIVRSVLLSTPYDAWHALFTSPAGAEPVVQAVITSILYTVVFAAAAWYLLRRREFAGADAVPAGRRRVTVRIGIAVVAVSGVLAGLSGVGPTALTASRLSTSIATAFGNLAEVRYQWQTGAKADTTIPWQATCDRGGVAGAANGTPASVGSANSKGAGDDWECIVIDTRASDGAGPTTLDVTLKANGCYEAQSPPGAVGALYVDDEHGKSFINPLYAFDGCFGTP
jgi:ABC-2 type transport system permease protein